MTDATTMQTDQTGDLKRQLAQRDKELDRIKGERDRAAATASEIAAAAAAEGVLPSAIVDVVHRALAQGDWQPGRDGRLVLQKDGFPSYDDNFALLTPEVFFRSLKGQTDGYYYFPRTDDCAAAGQGEPEKPPVIDGIEENPWSKPYWNLTRQAEIWVKDNALAERLAAAAGVPVIPGQGRK